MTELVRQRAEGDCGVAALAMAVEVSYEDAYVAIQQVPGLHTRHLRGKSGLYNSHVVKAAAILGVTLKPRRKFDLDVDEGVLRVHYPRAPHDHFVAVKSGLVFEPTFMLVQPWQTFCELTQVKLCTLLREE